MVSETLPRKIYNFSIKHWIYSGLILSLPTYYFLFIQLFGRNLGLINSNGIITETGLFIFWPFFIVLFLTSFAKTLSDKYNEKVMFNGQYVLRKLLSSTNSLKQTKTRRFVNYITDHHGQTDLDPFQNITNPILQTLCSFIRTFHHKTGIQPQCLLAVFKGTMHSDRIFTTLYARFYAKSEFY